MKFRLIDILLFSLLFIFVVSFPVDMLGLPLMYQYILSIGLKVLLLTYYAYTFWRYRINIFKFANYRRALLFIPFLIACFSNLIATKISGSNFILFYDPTILSLVIVSTVLTAINEEILFRYFIQNSLVFASSIKRIFVSALIFALFHLLSLVEVRSVVALTTILVQFVYTFGLGLILGFMYEYTYSLPLCMVFHLCFNFFNQVLVTRIIAFDINDTYTLTFYLTAVVIAVVLAIYGSLIYLLIFKKNDRYFRE